GRRLDDAQHVHEPLRPAEVLDEHDRARRPGGRSSEGGRAGQRAVAGHPRGQAEGRRAAREPAREEIPGDLVLPDGRAHDRAAVVALGRGLGHRRPPSRHAATPTARAPAATAADRHISGRSWVVSTGFGGRPYTSGSSSSRKNAPKPPTPSSGSSPYRRAPMNPSSTTLSSRAAARSRSSSSGPYWIDSVGHAWAQAGVIPSRVRS